ncbi:MAG: rhomboid family intramembrane serine protease, partial [Deltaproteobacteria bacterium]|nr:rhomboid family intramembrane serine protease [Deltaproteobacteria bacterium]
MALQAEGVRHRLEPPGEHPAWRVWVKVDEAIEGRRVLTEFERENTPIATPRVEAELSTWNVGLFFAVLCIVVQLATGPRDPHLAWFAKGSADAALIVAGQWWRALCALTLHAGLGHAFGNAAAGWLLMEAVARRLGPGRTSALTLLAGLVGNLLTAQVMRRSFESIGASTAVFGVLGAATVLQAFLRVRRGWI